MNELEVLLRRNKLDIMIIKASHELDKMKKIPNTKKEGLETLMDIFQLTIELQDEIRNQSKLMAKLKYENAIAYKEIAILKTSFEKYKKGLLEAEEQSIFKKLKK
jgi:hypothetical protein